MKTQKPNILLTIPNFKTAGSQYVLLSILRGLKASEFTVFVAVENNADSFPDDIENEARIVLEYSGKALKDGRYLAAKLKLHSIDILHSWDYKSTAREALACRLSGAKYIYTKKNNAWSRRWLLKSILSHHIAYDNPEMVNRFFKAFYLKSKISFIPHGVDLNSFKPQNSDTSEVFNLCCIGNIVANKNQSQIIEALSDLPSEIQLHLYGREDSGYRKVLNEVIIKRKLEDRVHFYGFVKNTKIPEILSSQNLFILASQQEGLPVSILEAMACGVPVLSSDSGGGARYILENDNGGYIFNSTEDLTQKIKTLYSDANKYNELKKKAVENVSKRLSLEREINAYKKLYLKLI